MEKEIFLSSKNSISNRWAIFKEDESSAWFYITEANQQKPIADCWVYNKVIAPKSLAEVQKYRNSPPPAILENVAKDYLRSDIIESQISFLWSKDGNSVSVLIEGYPMGYILSGEKRGYSRNLISNCAWGNVFNEEKFLLHFGDK
jgi:hypothetical protein